MQSAVSEPIKVPTFDDSPTYRAAVDNQNRISGEIAKAEAELEKLNAELHTRDGRMTDLDRKALAIIGGSKADVTKANTSARHAELTKNLPVLRHAYTMARDKVREAERIARHELMPPFWKSIYRPLVREVAAKMFELAKAMHVLNMVNENQTEGLMCDPMGAPFPCSRYGDPADPTNWLNILVSDLIIRGYFDPKADAELLAGFNPQVPTPFSPPPPPPAPAPKKKRKLLGIGDW